MHRYCCRPVTRLRCNLELHLNLVTGQQQYRCIVPKAVYIVKSAPEDGRVCCPKLVKRSINVICCILLVAYIVVLMVHGLTNVKFSQDSRPMWLDLNIGPTIAMQGCYPPVTDVVVSSLLSRAYDIHRTPGSLSDVFPTLNVETSSYKKKPIIRNWITGQFSGTFYRYSEST
jgi:hypothetical protein